MRKSFHLKLAQKYWKAHLKATDLAIDATCGNGHDTLFLSEICQVIGLDIQEKALTNTKSLVPSAILHHLSHEKIDTLPLSEAPKLIVYNLGYLPGGNKTVTTKTESTLESLKNGLKILHDQGALSITCYPGHEEGEKEEVAILEWAQSLDPSQYSACHHRWLNRKKAPSLLWICKIP